MDDIDVIADFQEQYAKLTQAIVLLDNNRGRMSNRAASIIATSMLELSSTIHDWVGT